MSRGHSPKAIHIGTSGWHYSHWKKHFYPSELNEEDYLEYYQRIFKTAEINNTFYQIPENNTLRRWVSATDPGFIFSVKASRYLTHMKKLRDPLRPVHNFLDKIQVLKDRLGPILFQLPPRWRKDLSRLRDFLEILPADYRYVFEFRDPDWFDGGVYALLERYGAAFCIYDLNRSTSPRRVTTDFVYIRLHGPGAPYKGKYDPQTLAGWAGAITQWKRQDKGVFCYFDNDERGYAALNAARLLKMTEGG